MIVKLRPAALRRREIIYYICGRPVLGSLPVPSSLFKDLEVNDRHFRNAGQLPWRMMPNDLPPWYSVQQQAKRWMRAGCFEAMAQDLRKVLRLLAGRHTEPSAVILDGRTLQSTPESGARAGYDGHKRKKGSKVHAAVDTLGHLLALKVTAANEQERAQVADLVEEVQQATGESVEVAFCLSRLHRRRTRRASSQAGHSSDRSQT